MSMTDSIEEGAIRICELFKGGGPFFVGRNGTIELEVLYFWLINRRGLENPREYPPRLVDQIQRNAGVFPATDSSIDRWCEAYATSLGWLDGLAAGWYAPLKVVEEAILNTFAPATAFRTPLRSLEPYYVPPAFQWTRQLAGKRVCVINSFADTISRQAWTDKFPKIWTGDRAGLLEAAADWSFIRTGYAPTTAMGRAGWGPDIHTWEDAVRTTVNRALTYQPDVAIIGCGALGMIIAAFLRERGVSCIVLGGATQVLFGIKGGRWASHAVISTFWNRYWVWPAADEVPGGANLVEGACYWRPPHLEN